MYNIEHTGGIISIHAPREGSDIARQPQTNGNDKFQSTLPARGATPSIGIIGRYCRFQSTLPARGATSKCWIAPDILADFNPRSPRGERR